MTNNITMWKYVRKTIAALIFISIYWPGAFVWELIKPDGHTWEWPWWGMPALGSIFFFTLALIFFAVWLWQDYWWKPHQ